MRPSPRTSRYPPWEQPCWEVRVRGGRDTPMYLWGSGGITKNIEFSRPLLLHVHNDVFGEEVIVGTRTADGGEDALGSLQAGEALSIPMQGLSGVFATCEFESTVSCLVKYID